MISFSSFFKQVLTYFLNDFAPSLLLHISLSSEIDFSLFVLIFVSRIQHKCSMESKSNDWLYHSRWCAFQSMTQFLYNFAVCFESLSCYKSNYCGCPNFLTEKGKCSFKCSESCKRSFSLLLNENHLLYLMKSIPESWWCHRRTS